MTGREIEVPKDLQKILERMCENILETLKESTSLPAGPTLTIQMIMLLLIRVGYVRNPNIVNQLKEAVDCAWEQYKREST